ncbi:hypothetical protein ACTMU2_29935 [Cupriavidus basilensis]
MALLEVNGLTTRFELEHGRSLRSTMFRSRSMQARSSASWASPVRASPSRHSR